MIERVRTNDPVRGDVETGALTRDEFLGGRIQLFQRRRGYRVTMDSVLLAAAAGAGANDRVLDLGSGSGAAALCLAARVAGVSVTGLELQPEMMTLASKNIEHNTLSDRVTMVAGDVARPPAALMARPFQHVIANPPYVSLGTGTLPPDPVKATARVEGHARLPGWIETAAACLVSGGTFTLVHRADRVPEILEQMSRNGFGDCIVFPLWPGPGRDRDYSRVLVRGTLDAEGSPVTRPGLVIHVPGGGYTPESEAVLRHGAALALA